MTKKHTKVETSHSDMLSDKLTNSDSKAIKQTSVKRPRDPSEGPTGEANRRLRSRIIKIQ